MKGRVRIGLVGERKAGVVSHQAIPIALEMAGKAVGVAVEQEWVPTGEISADSRVAGYDGIWCVPNTPYVSMEGALRAIRYFREEGRPFFGSCGGFQHAIIEFARNVLGWPDADTEETAPTAGHLVITPLACALLGQADTFRLEPGSRAAAIYGAPTATETYNCRYGINPDYQARLFAGALRVAAKDDSGQVRIVELDRHPFFVATLFQPERAALTGRLPLLPAAFVRAAAGH